MPVKIGGLAAGEEARVTVAAVDLGILNLTRYQAPAPGGLVLRPAPLGLEIRDFYGRLIDGMRAERGSLRSGGDGSGDMGLQGSPPVEETVALFSGIVQVERRRHRQRRLRDAELQRHRARDGRRLERRTSSATHRPTSSCATPWR